MAGSLRIKPGVMPARTSRRMVATWAYLASEVPPNVQEARQWIAAWKALQAPAAAPPPPAVTSAVPPNVQEARAWIAAWKARQVPASENPNGAGVQAVQTVETVATRTEAPGPAVAADGTLTFSKAFLNSSTYENLLSALAAKEKREQP